MKEFYVAIAEVYQDVQAATPRFEGNPCGDCRSCCTAAMKNHNVAEVEFATMAFHLGTETVSKFRSYLAHERDESGQLIYRECPNLGPQGCTVHDHRPLSCRLYGHFRSASAELFDHCVFRGHETVFPDESEHLLSPGQARLTELSIDYLSYFPYAASSPSRSAERAPSGPLETASYLQREGEFEAARDLLIELRQSEDSASVTLMLIGCHEALGHYESALEILKQAIERSPQNAELHSRQGANLLWTGQLPAARQSLERSLEIAPDRAKTMGLLGFVHQLLGDPRSAKGLLARSVDLEEEPGPYRFQLALVLLALDEVPQARAMLVGATEYEPTRLQAEEQLARIA